MTKCARYWYISSTYLTFIFNRNIYNILKVSTTFTFDFLFVKYFCCFTTFQKTYRVADNKTPSIPMLRSPTPSHVLYTFKQHENIIYT
jgi:hypothetical protein